LIRPPSAFSKNSAAKEFVIAGGIDKIRDLFGADRTRRGGKMTEPATRAKRFCKPEE